MNSLWNTLHSQHKRINTHQNSLGLSFSHSPQVWSRFIENINSRRKMCKYSGSTCCFCTFHLSPPAMCFRPRSHSRNESHCKSPLYCIPCVQTVHSLVIAHTWYSYFQVQWHWMARGNCCLWWQGTWLSIGPPLHFSSSKLLEPSCFGT